MARYGALAATTLGVQRMNHSSFKVPDVENQNVRIAVVGAGLIGKRHAEHAARQGILAAIVDSDSNVRVNATDLNVQRFFSLADLLSNEVIHGIVLATPNQIHMEQAKNCIDVGIPVLIEKPIADTVQAAKSIVDAGISNNVPILVGHHRRYSSIVRQAKLAINSGKLGRLVSAHSTCWFHKPKEYFSQSWRRRPGAGPVYINLIHDLDLMLHFCGDVVYVQAMESNSVRGNFVEDTAVVMLRFSNGALGTITLSDSISSPWSWEFCSGENSIYPHTKSTSLMIGGTLGSLSIPDLGFWTHENEPDWWTPMDRQQLPAETNDPLAEQLQHFVQVIKGLEEPIVSGKDGLNALRVVEAIKRAAKHQTNVKIEA